VGFRLKATDEDAVVGGLFAEEAERITVTGFEDGENLG
jgi:hypothetical protein